MQIKYLDKHGVGTLINEIKKRTSSIYIIKGDAIYADADYVTHAQGGDPGYEQDIDSVGLWKLINAVWTKITSYEPGWVYNIENGFTTDANFVEGAGVTVASGTNIAVVNNGTEAVPVLKFDMLARSLDLDELQTRELTSPLQVFSNETPVQYTSSASLPVTEAAATATIEDLMIAIIGGTSVEAGDVYRAYVEPNSLDPTQNDITWVKLGNQNTVEGSLTMLGNASPNTPITDEEIDAMFNA